MNEKYVYECKGEEIVLTNERTSLKYGKYFLVHCSKCCNIPIVHLLRRKKDE